MQKKQINLDNSDDSNRLKSLVQDISRDLGTSNNGLRKQLSQFSFEISSLRLPVILLQNRSISTLGWTVKFLHESKNLDLKTIAKIIRRAPTTIHSTYAKVKAKFKTVSINSSSTFSIPITLFANRKLSNLQWVCLYLRDKCNLSYHEIAFHINRDERTIWSAYNLAKKASLSLDAGEFLLDDKNANINSSSNIDIFLAKVNAEHNLSLKKIIEYLACQEPQENAIPVTFFQNRSISSLGVITKYLRDEKSYSFKKISDLLNRKFTTIHTTYSNTKKKFRVQPIVNQSSITIPIIIFVNRDISVLENIVVHLKDKFSLSYHEIAQLLNRDDRTIWTVYNKVLNE